ncbi:MAG: hypothetical protein DWH78_08115 [Planctomycetota bacterium]|nr:MAG: hypothetical protein DWH78_08115 [Planctomycetota bacterium]
MLVVQNLVPDEELASNDWEKNPPAHLWTAEGFGEGSAALLLIDGHLSFRYQDGTIALIEASPAEYKLKGNFAPDYQKGNSWAHPVVVNGKLYLREQDKLMFYQVGK